ncbi:hypothetical protein PAXINDRAFT_22283 [Paxillus involutus ATCC 200175]|uniref:Unplaced genomic scaffold PAXINscaffold_2517, whole genome shotgun sequence n=1 Tax=Paxillus involutus ATCC 200175 TaxID=664439 RepID=A0A0C9SSB1_PAXIN|nr:hypothetical protein PAXINDRAFT_22283 [Paxillus involutus ATCC 200175]
MPRSLNNSNLTFDLTNSIVRSDDHLACHAGSFGDVYKCKYRSGSGLKEVAVKALRLIKIKLEELEETSWSTESSKSGGDFVTGTSSGFKMASSDLLLWYLYGWHMELFKRS